MSYQRFYATIVNKDGKVRYLSPIRCDEGSSLIEHTSFNNTYVNSVLKQLDKGDRLYWLGDCAEYNDLNNKDLKMSEDDFDNLYDSVWESCENASFYDIYKFSPCLVINLTKKCYINMRDLDDTFNQIPLLCVVGNGKGDYEYVGDNSEMCGTWAGDEIYSSNCFEDIEGLEDFTNKVRFDG